MFKKLVLCALMGCAFGTYDFAGYYGYLTPAEYINAASAPYYSNPVPAPESVFPKEASTVYLKEISAMPVGYLKEENKEAAAPAENEAQQTLTKEEAPSAALVQEAQPVAEVFNAESAQPILSSETETVAEYKQEGPSAAYIKPSWNYYAKPKYQYKYEVDDCYTGDKKSHKEERDGDKTKGQYSVNQPDGTILTVDYSVVGNSGYNAVVKTIGKPIYPAYIPTKKLYTSGPW